MSKRSSKNETKKSDYEQLKTQNQKLHEIYGLKSKQNSGLDLVENLRSKMDPKDFEKIKIEYAALIEAAAELIDPGIGLIKLKPIFPEKIDNFS